MAFGTDGSRTDVELGVNLGQFRTQMGQAGQVYEQTTGRMSKDSLRAAIAHEKLLRAIKRSGPESIAAKNATLAYRREMDALERESRQATHSLDRQERSVGRLARGSLAGAGALGRLRGAAVFASSSFLGGFGITYAIKTAVDAASNLAEQGSKVKQVFGAAAGTLVAWSRTTAAGIGIARDKALEAVGVFGNLFNTVGLLPKRNADLSRTLVQLAADLASFNNADPSEALDAIRSGVIGEAEPLRRFGVLLSENRVKQEALRETGKKNAGQLTDQEKLLARVAIILKDTTKAQGDYARTADGLANSQRSVTAEIRDTEIVAGQALLPAVRDITHGVEDYLGKAENQQRIQRDVNEAVRVGGRVAHGLADGLEDIRTVAGPVVHQLGGVERTAKLMLEAFAVYKLAKIAGAIRAIGLGARFSRREITLLNETPVLPKTTPGVPGGGVPVPLPGPGGGVPAPLPGPGLPRGFGASSLLLGAAAGALLAIGQRGETSMHVGGPLDVSLGPGDLVSYRDPATGKYILVNGFHGKAAKSLEAFIRADLLKRHPELAQPQITGEDIAQRGAGARTRTGQATGAGGGGRGGGGSSGRLGLKARFARAELALAKAESADDQRAERQALDQQQKILEQEIASPKKAFKDKKALYNELDSVHGRIDALDQEQSDKRRRANEKRRQARDRKRAAAKERADAARERREERREERIGALTEIPIGLRIQELKAEASHASEHKLLAIYRRELTAIEQQLQVIKQLHVSRKRKAELELAARQEAAAIQSKIDDVKKRKKAGGTSVDVFAEAAENFRLYGGNIAGRDGILSSQDARGEVGRQILRELREINRHGKSTADSTSKIGKGGVDQITMARALAGQGL